MIRKHPGLELLAVVAVVAASLGLDMESSSAHQLAARADQPQQGASVRPSVSPAVTAAAPAQTARDSTTDVKPVRRIAGKGPYYVDFRARTAATSAAASDSMPEAAPIATAAPPADGLRADVAARGRRDELEAVRPEGCVWFAT